MFITCLNEGSYGEFATTYLSSVKWYDKVRGAVWGIIFDILGTDIWCDNIWGVWIRSDASWCHVDCTERGEDSSPSEPTCQKGRTCGLWKSYQSLVSLFFVHLTSDFGLWVQKCHLWMSPLPCWCWCSAISVSLSRILWTATAPGHADSTLYQRLSPSLSKVTSCYPCFFLLLVPGWLTKESIRGSRLSVYPVI